MNDAQPSGANGGLKAGALSPDELDKIAALFVPTWDQPADAAGVPPPPDDVLAGAMQPAPQKNDPKRTQMGIAAPMQPPPEAAFVPPKRAAVDPMAPTGVLDLGAVPAQPAVMKPKPVSAPSLADQSTDIPAIARKRSPLIYVVGGGVVVAALAIFFATRGGDKPEPPKETSAPTVESKKLDLPDPNSVSTGAAAANTATATATTAAATETATAAPATTAADTATAAKTAEPEPPKATATAAPKPTAPPPTPKMTATAAPKPPPATATPKPPTKKAPQKIKDEF